MTRPGQASRAFTLIELVLVMLIIGLLLAVVAPTLGGLLRSQRLDQSTRTVTAMLKEARVLASSEARPYRLVIDTEDNTCWLEALTAQGFQRPQSTSGKILELGDLLTIELDGGMTEGNLFMVRVEPDGTSELAQITLTRQQDGRQLAVACKTPTEAYTIGKPVSLQQLLNEGDDVDVDR